MFIRPRCLNETCFCLDKYHTWFLVILTILLLENLFRVSLNKAHTSEKCDVIKSIDHAQKFMTKSGYLHMLQKVNSVDYSMSLYGLCYHPCHDK